VRHAVFSGSFRTSVTVGLREALERRRERLKQSTVLQRRSYGSGILQLELRANSKTATTRGPYWYFHYREEESSAPFTLARPTTRRALWPRSSAGRAQGDEASHEHAPSPLRRLLPESLEPLSVAVKALRPSGACPGVAVASGRCLEHARVAREGSIAATSAPSRTSPGEVSQ
jgi:hypothetical protein